MKNIFIVVGILLTLISCQPNFADPELEDRVSLLENRIVTLEEQMKGLRTAVNAHTFNKESNKSSNLQDEPPVKTTTNSIPSGQTPSTDYPESRKRSPGRSSSYSGRCQAITRKGTQCKRSSRSGGYCWQHGG